MTYVLCNCGNLIAESNDKDDKYLCFRCGPQVKPYLHGVARNTGVELTREQYIKLSSTKQPNFGKETVECYRK